MSAATRPAASEATAPDAAPPNSATVAVRDLAAFVHRRGDIHYRYTSSATAQEGISAQRRAQPEREGYRREVPVEATFTRNGVELRIRGRIDGFDDGAGLIEEYKTTRSEVPALHGHIGHLHMAQLKLYAGLVNATEAPPASRDAWRLRLIYLHPDDGTATPFEAEHGRDELAEFLVETIAAYTAWLARTAARVARRNARLGRLPFPYPEFRDSQRRLARGAYRAFRDREQLLVEAPTGSGKTAATVYSALRAIGEGVLDRVVYLTARTTGKQSPTETLARCALAEKRGDSHRPRCQGDSHKPERRGDSHKQARCQGDSHRQGQGDSHQGQGDSHRQGQGDSHRQGRHEEEPTTAVVLTAKRDICFNPEEPCDPACCRYARGYYDRMRPARDALLASGVATRETIEAIARRHTVCPFEISLDAAAWADVVVCDYNYVFDPVVRLERLAAPPFSRVGLLVDEAHQLGDRVRGMLSTSMRRGALKRALAEAPPPDIARRLRAVDRALLKLRREAGGAESGSVEPAAFTGPVDINSQSGDVDSGAESRIAEPKALLRAIERLLDAAAQTDLASYPATSEFLFHCFRVQEGQGWRDGENYCDLLATDRRNIEARMVCLSPAPHIDAVLRRYNGAVRFSGTVSPLPLFQAVHGQGASDGSRAARVCPEWGSNLGVFVVGDVSTYYRDRAASRDALAGVVEAVIEAAPGNYLVAFPSFAYLDLVVPRLEGVAEVVAQRPGMTDAEKQAFIGRLSERNETPARNGNPRANGSRIGAAVLGGMFAESVDFDGGALKGVIVVGVGLAPRSLERDLIGERFGADGFDVAYRQPGMTRVAQAAGRAVRGVGDTGVVVLVDPRFTQVPWSAFFPRYWRPVPAGSREIGAAVASFWRGRW